MDGFVAKVRGQRAEGQKPKSIRHSVFDVLLHRSCCLVVSSLVALRSHDFVLAALRLLDKSAYVTQSGL
jgi:hypothetical protein